MTSLLIRREEASDAAAIHEVVAAAFGQEDEARLVEALRGTEAWVPELSLVAIAQGAIVGHVLFTRLHVVDGFRRRDEPVAGPMGLRRNQGSSAPNPNGTRRHPGLALAPVAVVPVRQRSGVGTALVRAGHARAAAAGFAFAVVLGHPEYYPSFGYSPASRFEIRAPFAVADEAFLALELQPGALTGVRGVVEYAPPFAAF